MPATPEPQVWPTLRAHDARALITFLVDAFGFEETVVYGDGDRVDHAQLSWPEGGGVMLGSVREGDTDAHGQGQGSTPTRPGTFGAYVVTDHVDAVYQRARAAGAEIITEPYDTDYGSHDFAAADPEGNRWSFGTYRGEPRKGALPGNHGGVARGTTRVQPGCYGHLARSSVPVCEPGTSRRRGRSPATRCACTRKTKYRGQGPESCCSGSWPAASAAPTCT